MPPAARQPRRRVRREILAPGDHVHLEGQADTRHPLADLAEAQQTETPALQVAADRGLPRPAAAKREVFRHQMPGQRENQRPGQLRRRLGPAGRAAHGDAAAHGGRARRSPRCACRWSPAGAGEGGARAGWRETPCVPASPRRCRTRPVPRRRRPRWPADRAAASRPPRNPATASRPSPARRAGSRRGSRSEVWSFPVYLIVLDAAP